LSTLLVTKTAGVQAKPVPGTDVTYKIENYSIFELVKKNVLANVQRIIENFSQNFFSLSSENNRLGIRDSGKHDPQHCL
jgi:hypothetical protein